MDALSAAGVHECVIVIGDLGERGPDGSMALDVMRMGIRAWAEIDTMEKLADAAQLGHWTTLRADAQLREGEADLGGGRR
jgi:hypothetical protein